MGVTGLWRLIEPSGKPVPLETLENKVLAIDVSIWLHQAIKGFQDAQGAPLPNAHLLGIYHRVCKLLYFRIKPIFVFDGGVPNLKKETISKRNQQKQKKLSEADRLQKQLLTTLLKHSAVNKILSEKTKAAVISNSKTLDKPQEDIYKLPPTQLDSTLSSSDEEPSTTDSSSPSKPWDTHTIDVKSPHFKSLPADVRHEILTDLKETRKQSSWGRLHELPKQSDEFSGFQMNRLLKRNSVQVSLEQAEKEMGGRSLSLAELETLLEEQGVETAASNSLGRRIASDENTRFLLIKNVKKAMDEAKKQKELEDIKEVEQTEITEGDVQFQEDLEQAIQLSLQDVPSTSKQSPNYSFQDFNDASSDEGEVIDNNKKLSSAQNYMLEYSGLTPNEIAKIINNNSDLPSKKLNCKSKPVITLIGDQDEIVPSSTVLNNGATNVISSDESSSDDFLEVSTGLEILIKPEDSLEDDLFSDIFSNKKENQEISISELINAVSEHKSTEENENVNEIAPKAGKKDEESTTNRNSSEEAEKSTNLEVINLRTTEENKAVIEIEDEESTTNHNSSDEAQKSTDFEETKSEVINLGTTEENEAIIEIEDEELTANRNYIEEPEKSNNVPESREERTRNVVAEFLKPLDVNEKISDENKITTEQLEEIESNLRQEKEDLISGKLSKERMAGSLTDQIYQEAQELLTLFGVPFIVAPMEAEAQCAFLDDINLTDGTITDDSDIWLFGGKTVYKNFFNQHKHVQEFRAENVQHHFKLTREQMILLALLVGSDYTVGIQGVGPVTALEILAAFPPSKLTNQLISGLEEFRKWLSGERAAGPGRATLRNKLKNVTFTDSFPSLQVVKAYLEPTIDSSNEPFSWAKPDIVGLTAFARQKFGWTRIKSEEILKPVVKRLNESRIQRSIKDYFQTKHKIDSVDAENKMSKRVKKAINRIGRDPNENSDEEKKKKPVGKRRQKKKVIKEGFSSDEDVQVLQKTRIQSKKKLEQIESEVKNEIEVQIKKPRTIESLHKKEVIPQKEQDKVDTLRNKIKAIEVFRKSKKGPGFLGKRKNVQRKPKEDAELSESSSSN